MPTSCDIFKLGDPGYQQAAKEFIGTMQGLGGERAEAAERLADEYLTKGDKYIAYSRDPSFHGLAGLMILSIHDAYVKVECICTNPLTKGVGVQLIERAVNESFKLGKGGCIALTDMSGSTFYSRLGFEPVPGESLKKELDPTGSYKWEQRETASGTLRFKAVQG